MKLIKFFVFIFFVSFSSIFSQTLVHPVNLNFEQAQEGGIPFGWRFQRNFTELGYQAYATTKGTIEGNYCLQLENIYPNISDIKNPDMKPLQSVVFQEIDAEYFRGKDVFFGIKYKVYNSNSINAALIFIQQENNDIHFFRLSSSDTLRASEWTDASISLRIDSLAKVIKFGVISFGLAKVQFDEGIFNFNYDFTKNHPPIKISDEISRNLLDLAKVYGTVKYFYPSPFLKDYPWDVLLYDQIEKAVSLDKLKFIKNLETTFYNIAQNSSNSNTKVTSASNYVYTGLPAKINTPLSNQRISDIFKSNKDYPATLINFVNIINEKPNEVDLTVKYKFSPYAANAKAGLWLRFDNAETGSLGETKAEPFEIDNQKWNIAHISAKAPDGTVTLRIGLVLEGDGEVLFDDLKVNFKDKNGVKPFNVRNSDFEAPLVNNYISGWNFPQYAINSGYSISLSDETAEGKHSLKISSNKEELIKFPPLNWNFSDTLSNGLVFKTPITVPVSSLKDNENQNLYTPQNFSINFEDSFSRFAIIIELWNYLRHFSIKPINSINLEDFFLGAIYEANSAISVSAFQKVLEGLISVSNDVNYKIWYGFEQMPYFPELGIFVGSKIDSKSVFTTLSDSCGIPSGSKIVRIDNSDIDSLIKVSLNLNKNNTQSNKYIIEKEITKCLSGYKNLLKSITFITPKQKTETVKVRLNSLVLKPIKKPYFADEVSPGIIYLNSVMMSDEELKSILPKLQDKSVEGLIIDLRGYTLFSEHILGLFSEKQLTGFVSEIPIYTAPNHTYISKSILQNKLESIPKLQDKKVIFLIDENSNSYSEIIAALARINKIGTVLGTPTQGNITEVEQIILPGYFFASQSILKIKLQDNPNYLEKQVLPDITVEQTLKSALENKDDPLEAAIELLKKK